MIDSMLSLLQVKLTCFHQKFIFRAKILALTLDPGPKISAHDLQDRTFFLSCSYQELADFARFLADRQKNGTKSYADPRSRAKYFSSFLLFL
jgi:hypothetical protein